jgi:hypothetical protein
MRDQQRGELKMTNRTTARTVSRLVAGSLAVGAVVISLTNAAGAQPVPTTQSKGAVNIAGHPYVGMWVTPDDHIRHQLLPNGRYDEARGSRKSAYQGRYGVRGNHVDYWDDTGFTADGTFVSENEFHHAGMTCAASDD